MMDQASSNVLDQRSQEASPIFVSLKVSGGSVRPKSLRSERRKRGLGAFGSPDELLASSITAKVPNARTHGSARSRGSSEPPFGLLAAQMHARRPGVTDNP